MLEADAHVGEEYPDLAAKTDAVMTVKRQAGLISALKSDGMMDLLKDRKSSHWLWPA